MEKYFKINNQLNKELFDKLSTVCDDRLRYGGFELENEDRLKDLLKWQVDDVIPDEEQLSKLIEVALAASIKKEEGRSLAFTIGFHNLKAPTDDPSLYLFATPLKLSVEQLFKLAPSLENTLALVVKVVDNELKIIGLYSKLDYNSNIPVQIKVLDPGEILVALLSQNIAKISLTEITFITNPYDHYDPSVWVGFPFSPKPWVDPYILLVRHTLMKMRLLGHGGCLIILDNNNQNIPHTEVLYPIVTQSSFVTNIVKSLAKSMFEEFNKGTLTPWNNIPTGFVNEIETVAQIMAQLTCVDGATLLTREFELIGYGVKLTSPADTDFFIEERNCMTGRTSRHDVKTMKGTRHQSAARFVYNTHNALAFVVSQDRNITVLCRHNNNVQANRYFEVSLF